MRLYFIRHGEKEAGAEINPIIGHTDPPLTRHGVEQAEALPRFFEGESVDYVYASEYLRVRQTAEPLARDRNLTIAIDRRLNEIDNGIIETMPDAEIERQFPEFWRDFFEHRRDCRFPGGETGEEVRARQNDLLREISGKEGTHVLFCHEGYIRILMCNLLGMPVYHRYKFKYDYCGITEVALENAEWKIRRFNQSAAAVR
jgi:broad specificity phosphatase PhoE